MTTITSNSTVGIYLRSPAYINPIVINPAVAISNYGEGISGSPTTWTIQNYGFISGTGTSGVGVDLDGGSVTNAAPVLITGVRYGVEFLGGVGTVANHGGIAGTGTSGVGIRLSDGGSVTNAASASIVGGLFGVIMNNNGTVINDGGIAGTGTSGVGVTLVGGAAVVTNGASASIMGAVDGVDVGGGTIVNYGSIAATGTSGIGVNISNGSASVTNAASASITGMGGGVFVTASGVVVNDGSISGTGSSANGVQLSGGSVTNAASASITGAVDGVGIMSSGTVINDGNIVGGTSGRGVVVGVVALVTNEPSGSITGGLAGVALGIGTVVNYGSIAGTGASGIGIFIEGSGSVSNAASASITGGDGVEIFSGNANVVNNGSITGTGTDGFGVLINSSGRAGTVVNDGSIAGTGTSGTGVTLQSGGSVTNAASASIMGGAEGVEISGGTGIVVNDGSVAGTTGNGVSLGTGGSVTNATSASITGSSSGVLIQGSAGTVINAGSIGGESFFFGGGFMGSGISLEAGGSVTNAASASIAGSDGLIVTGGVGTVVNYGGIGGAGDYYSGLIGVGVALNSGGSVTNAISGRILGYDAVQVSGGTGTIVNYGFISGGGVEKLFQGPVGVYLGAGGSVTNAASATIGGYQGVEGNGGAITVVNAGEIYGIPITGVALRDGGSVTNQSSGQIRGGYDGVLGVDVTVVNYGRIAAYNKGDPREAGVGLASGLVTNAASASIYSKYIGVSLYGGTLTNAGTIIGNNGTAAYLGGTSSNLLVLNPGYGLSGIAVGGTSAANTLELTSAASAGTLSGLGTEFVNFAQTTIDAGASWVFTGANTIEAGTTLTELSGATLTVSGTLANDGSIVIDPSTLIAGGLTGTGIVTIDAGSTLEVQGTVASGETIKFGGSGADLVLDNPGSVAGSVTNFDVGETIDLVGITGTVSYSDGLLSFSGGSFPLSLTNPGSVSVSVNDGTVSVTVLCFCVNTLIATPSGERPVQELAVGDTVMTHRGEARRIAWVGAGKVLATQGRRNAATPVIVSQGALADNVPNRDLRVTKGHSFYIDDVLIPVEFLINHRSIYWDDNAQEVELYHIELETHDVLLANGAPAESYRDDGNRWLFHNANSGWGLPPQTPCAPVLTGGPVVDAAWRRLLERAGSRPGIHTTDNPDLHLLVDGQRVDADSRSDVWHAFRLPAPPATERIVSRTGVPQEMGLARHPRCLGVALRQIMVTRSAQIRTIEAEDALLTGGFHEYEADNDIRWTDGDAAIPAGLFEDFTGPLEITLRLGGRTRYPDEGTVLRAA